MDVWAEALSFMTHGCCVATSVSRCVHSRTLHTFHWRKQWQAALRGKQMTSLLCGVHWQPWGNFRRLANYKNKDEQYLMFVFFCQLLWFSDVNLPLVDRVISIQALRIFNTLPVLIFWCLLKAIVFAVSNRFISILWNIFNVNMVKLDVSFLIHTQSAFM